MLLLLFLSTLKMHSNQKGLLPEPNPVQIMKSLNNPAMLQVLLQPQLCGRAVKPGKHHASPSSTDLHESLMLHGMRDVKTCIACSNAPLGLFISFLELLMIISQLCEMVHLGRLVGTI